MTRLQCHTHYLFCLKIMRARDIIDRLLPKKQVLSPRQSASAFAPSNIALIKYWGKRDQVLNLPVTSSLSISLGDKGTYTDISLSDKGTHTACLNGQVLQRDGIFYRRLAQFLDLLRPDDTIYYHVDTRNNIPTAAGLASSASGFAALVKALNTLHQWQLSATQQSILARMGSGSACRSLWHGFVQWQCGERGDGMDCYAQPLTYQWSSLRFGLVVVSEQVKQVGSRDGMNHTVATSRLYQKWPYHVQQALLMMHKALNNKDFTLLGETAERNAVMLHQTMQDSRPPLVYSIAATVVSQDQVYQLRKAGVPVYFTQDAGPNIKLLFEVKDQSAVQRAFPQMQVVDPFVDPMDGKVAGNS